MFQIVLTTCPNIDNAKEIAKILVSDKLAACINIVPNVTSVYHWQGQVMCDEEVQLLIKIPSNAFDALALRLKNLHPYEIPEIIALNVQQGDKHYLNWITDSMK